MKRKLIISTFLTISLLFIGAMQNARLADDKNFTIYLDSNSLVFDDPIVTQNGTIMLPLKNTLDSVNAHFDYYDAQKKINCYYNNSFAKLYIDKNISFINGNQREFHQPISLINGKAYGPLKFFCDFLNLEPHINDENIQLVSREDTNYVYLNSKLNIENKFEDLNLSIALPEGWAYLNDGFFGIDNPYEKYGFKVTISETNQKLNLEQYLDTIIRNEKPSKDFNMVDIKKSTIKTDNHNFYVLYYTIEENQAQEIDENISNNNTKENNKNPDMNKSLELSSESGKQNDTPKEATARMKPTHHAYYVFQEGNTLYEIHFKHQKNKLEHSILKSFEDSLSTIQVPPFNMSPSYEHYIEYPKFSELNIELSSKLHSSLEVYDKFNFAGRVNNLNNSKLYSKVSRNKQEKISLIPVDEKGNFDALIYAPFGIGKQNVKIFQKNEDGEEIPVIQFNIINLSPKKIYYLVPGEYIRPDSEHVKKTLNDILNNKTKTSSDKYISEYQIALGIFNYMVKEINFDPNYYFTEDEIISANKISLDEKINSINANIFLCSLMRSAEIPCRILKGKNNVTENIYVECLINGSWKVFDLNSELIKINNKGLTNNSNEEYLKINQNVTPFQAFSRFYYIDSVIYQQLFSEVIYLDY